MDANLLKKGINQLTVDVQALNPNDEDEEEKLSRSVENLLKRVYAYISWGIRYQVDSEREVDQTLKDLGFRIPDRVPGRHLFDIVVPAVLLVAGIVTALTSLPAASETSEV